MNKVILMGRLTADPELRQTQSGISSCRFTVAINRSFVDKNSGQRQADFITCVAW
jgi:single-strand DNA-binding protein